MAEGYLRPAWAEVDLDAVAHNVELLRRIAGPACLCAVVKADAYGHGAVDVSRAAVAAGAQWLAVAIPEEGIELRRAGVEAPVLVLSEPDPAVMAEAVAAGLTPTVYRPAGVAAASAAALRTGRGPAAVHLNVDTGMHRAGADPADAVELALSIERAPGLRLEGLWTHFAVADAPEDSFTSLQLERFEAVRARLLAAGVDPPIVHAANSAGALAHPASRYDMVRCGIAVYGYRPRPGMGGHVADGLRPVLSLRARVAMVRHLDAGERPSYGRRRPLPDRGWVATVPLGYADGVPRGLLEGGVPVLVNGRRRPLAGAVTMDQVLVDCGPEPPVAAGDEVVLLGRQGDEAVTADEWAAALGTISYEVLCGIGARVPRVAFKGGTPVPGSLRPGLSLAGSSDVEGVEERAGRPDVGAALSTHRAHFPIP